MQLGFVGLGKMGGNMVRRLVAQGQAVVVWDPDPEAVRAAQVAGATPATNLADLAGRLSGRRAVWLMVPAGDPVDATLAVLAPLLAKGDIVVDGGNSNWKDSQRRGREMAAQGIEFIDCGTSGGVWGLENGYCLMYGGAADPCSHLAPVFAALAPENGFRHCGPVGAGHFVKMVHNGIEYGMMQAYAEGFELLARSPFEIDTAAVAGLWREGSVVRSWLLDLVARALAENGTLAGIEPWVADSGEGRWTVAAGVELGVPLPVISQALFARFASRDDDAFGLKLLAALRDQFGGHGLRTTP